MKQTLHPFFFHNSPLSQQLQYNFLLIHNQFKIKLSLLFLSLLRFQVILMKHTFIQSLCALSLSAFAFTAMSAHAADEKIEVTPTPAVTNQELAAIYVLSEVCPKLVDDKDQNKFNAGYAKLAKEYMPKEKNAVTALEHLSKQKSFKEALKEAKSDAKKAGDKKNGEICKELTAYSK